MCGGGSSGLLFDSEIFSGWDGIGRCTTYGREVLGEVYAEDYEGLGRVRDNEGTGCIGIYVCNI